MTRTSVYFKLRGVAPKRVRSGRVIGARGSRRLPRRKLRAAARTGTLRVRRSAGVFGRRDFARMSGRRRKPPRVEVVVAPAPTPEPSPTPTPTPEPAPSGTATPSSTAPAGTIPSGAFFLSPSGSDSAAGTSEQPWRSLAKAISAAGPGATVVLRPGTYGAVGTKVEFTKSGTAGAPITFMGTPGETRPTVLGAIKVRGDHLRLRGLLLDGPTGPVLTRTETNPLGEEVQVSIYGDHVELSGCEVRDSLWHAGIYMDDAYDVTVVGNYVHDNGNFSRPEQANLDHGIYWGRGSGLVANNIIEHNVAHGVQLYPYAANVVVKQNTIVGNGKSGVILGKEVANNLIAGNIVARNTDNSIRSSGLTGTGNVVDGNVVWANGSGNIGTSSDGLTIRNTIQADPRFAGSQDYHLLAGSPAIDRPFGSTSMDVDYDGRPRPLGAAPDMGAYEAG